MSVAGEEKRVRDSGGGSSRCSLHGHSNRAEFGLHHGGVVVSGRTMTSCARSFRTSGEHRPALVARQAPAKAPESARRGGRGGRAAATQRAEGNTPVLHSL